MTTSPTTMPNPPAFPAGRALTGSSERRLSQVTYTHPNTKKIPSALTPASVQPYFTSASTGAVGIASDTAWATRTAIELLPGIDKPSGVISDQAVGALTMMNSVSGAINLYKSTQALKEAHAIDDADGATAAGINMAASTAQSGFGTATIGSRSTSIAAALAPSKTGLATAATIFGFIANIFVVLLFAFIGGWGAFQSRRAKKFYEKAVQNKSFEVLVASLYVPHKDVKQMIREDSIALRSSGLKALRKVLGNNTTERRCIPYCHASSKKKNALLEKVLRESFLKEYPELLEIKEFYLSKLDEKTFTQMDLPVAIGLLLKLRKLQLKNQAVAARALGSEQLQKIQRAAQRGLEARLASTGAVAETAHREWEDLKASIDASYAKTQFEYKSTALLGLLGTVVGILTFVLTGPYGAAILIALTLVWALACTIHDAYTHEVTGQPGRFDKLYLKVGIALIALSIAASVGSFLAFGGSLPIMVLSVALALVLLGILAHHLLQLQAYEKRWNATHTGVGDLVKHLKRGAFDAKARRLFKQLPKDLRIAITDEAARAKRRRELTYNTMNSIDKEKFHRAVKNSAVFFWKQWWYSNKNDYFKKQALLLEELALSIQYDRNEDAMRPVKHAFKQIRDRDTLDVLFEQAHRIFAREASAASLYKAAKRFDAA
jgi:hypothetical protein